MKKFLYALLCLFVINESYGAACDTSFSTSDHPAKIYPSQRISDFVQNEIRPQLKAAPASDTFEIRMVYHCSGAPEVSKAALLTMQRNNYYIIALNHVPLQCRGSGSCGTASYDYVRYKLEVDDQNRPEPVKVSVKDLTDSVDQAAAYKKINQFSIAEDSAKAKQLHRLIQVFAFYFAEAARFNDVMDGIKATESGCNLDYLPYWPLLHAWGDISRAVRSHPGEAPLPASTYIGDNGHGAALYAPITSEMREYYNSVREPNRKPVPATALQCSI